MIFRERRGLLIIIAALIVFDYVLAAYQNANYDWFIRSDANGSGIPADEQKRFLNIYYWSMYAIGMVGYTIIGWTAMQYARVRNFKNAARPRPFGHLFLALVCFTGLDLVTTQLTPGLLIWREWFADPEARFYFFGTIAVGLTLYLAGAYFLSRQFSDNVFSVINSAFFRFLVATQIIQWAHAPSSYNHSDILWVRTAIHYLSEFTYTALWDVGFIAFIVVLATPGENKASPA